MNFVYITLQSNIIPKTKTIIFMKIKSLLFMLCAILFMASCTDKNALQENETLRADMRRSDSICVADKQALMDSIMMLSQRMDSLMMPADATASQTTGTRSTGSSTKTTTTTTNTSAPDVHNKSGATNTSDPNKKADVHKKSGATQTKSGDDDDDN